ncbi:hypothetical protein, partial [Bifidobacterium longum]|uniref:hypothetical protein n=1 Tax=Bifidobacterium longum TaxID=216816 RepID=UPI001A955C16
VESAVTWLRALVSNRGLFCLATENRTQDTGHVSISGPQPICAKSRALSVQVLQVEQPDSEQFLGGGVIGNQVHCERGLRYPVDGTAVEGGAVPVIYL